MTRSEPAAPFFEVYRADHGIAGQHGRPAAPLDVPRDQRVLETAFWISEPSRAVDLHVGFRARFQTTAAEDLRLVVQSSSVFRVWLDGELIVHGPLRFAPSLPELHTNIVPVLPGEHSVCVEAHDEGIMTRTTAPIPPFVIASVSDSTGPLELDWRARELDYYGRTGLRVSPLLGWMETHDEPAVEWRALPDSDPSWRSAVPAREALSILGAPTESVMTLPSWPLTPLRETARGTYLDTFAGYDLDDPAAQFLLADDEPPTGSPIDGYWFRYDLDHVRLGSVELTLELEQPGNVIICYAERLTPDDRPSPIVPLSLGPTRMIQQYAVPAGVSVISPLQSLGARYVEVRVRTDGDVRVREADFRERDYLGEPTGSFESDDALLNSIWSTGIRTLRSSTEDAVVDSLRERGEWLGDVASAAHRIMQAGWNDTSPIERALLHAAAGAREDGLVAGCGPGGLIYLGTYAAQWFGACLLFAETEGNDRLLRALVAAARANITAIVRLVHDDGTTSLPWGFVDWGYSAPEDGPDPAVLAHVVIALRDWKRWLLQLGYVDELRTWDEQHRRISDILRSAIKESPSPYHAYTLGYHARVVSSDEALPHILARFEAGFPFDRDATRLKNPTMTEKTIVTPYFTNYSMPILLDAGYGEKVRELWRDGWGWMLSEGATTWWEIFDDRWSRCHSWSGAPTWQLTRHTLGLRRTAEPGCFEIAVNTLGLHSVHGRVPLSGNNLAHVSWQRVGGEVLYTIRSDEPITVSVGDCRFDVFEEPQTFVLRPQRGDLHR